MHLLISDASDVTSDIICERLGNAILRLNWERWNEYSLDITHSGFQLSDRFGRQVSESTIGNIIWRKPIYTVDINPGEFWYCFQEFKYCVRSIMEQIRQMNPRKLPIDPNHNTNIDKFRQLRVASHYFSVPDWTFTCNPSQKVFAEKNWIIKSLTGEPIPGTGEFSKVIYTTPVNTPATLSDGFPWFLQERISAPLDLTVVFVDGKQFAFTLDRGLFEGLDWRKSIGTKVVDDAWQQVELDAELQTSISNLMRDLGLRFGRLDLLALDKRHTATGGQMIAANETRFLEVNPNGQWAWLDLKQNNGLFDAVIQFLTS